MPSVGVMANKRNAILDRLSHKPTSVLYVDIIGDLGQIPVEQLRLFQALTVLDLVGVVEVFAVMLIEYK